METPAREDRAELLSQLSYLYTVGQRFLFFKLTKSRRTFCVKFQVGVFTHGVIPGSSHTQALGISSQGNNEARFMGLAIMEGCNGALCGTGCVAEADSDLHC